MATKVRWKWFLIPILGFALLAGGVVVQVQAGKPGGGGGGTFPPMPINYMVTWLRSPNVAGETWATGSNDAGTVAGYYEDATGQNRACIWTATGDFFDLNDLASVPDDPDRKWILVTARAINNSGQIAGSAQRRVTGLVRVYRYDPPKDNAPAHVTLMGDLTSAVSHQIAYGRPLNNLGDVAYAMNLADG